MVENLGFLTVSSRNSGGLIGGYLVLNPAARPLEFLCTTPVQPEKIQEILYGETLLPFLCGEKIAKTLVQRAKTAVSCIFTNHAAVLPIQNESAVPVIYVFDPLPENPALFSPSSLPPVSLPFGAETGEKTDVNENLTDEKLTDMKLTDMNLTDEKLTTEKLTGENLTETGLTEELNESLKSFGIENVRRAAPHLRNSGLPKLPDIAGFDTSLWQEIRIGNRTAAIPRFSEESFQQIVADVMQLAKTVDIREPFERIRLALDEAAKAA